MILEIFNIRSLERVGMIKTCEFAQYTEKFCGVGTFSLKIPTSEESIEFLTKEHFILFEDDIMGIIRYRRKSDDEDSSTVEIKGYLLNKILEWRSFLYTKVLKGGITDIAREVVDELFINCVDYRRVIPFIGLSTDEEFIPESPTTSIQVTGSTAEYVLETLLNPISYGFSLVPIIAKYNDAIGMTTNISEISFRVLKSSDRSIGNSDGNNPVHFSASMNNLSSSVYTEDYTQFCSVAIVAGEGEGSERTIVEVGDSDATGIDRIELYVDARDLQSVTENSIMTDEEYAEALTNRGYSYLDNRAAYSSMDGTVIDGASSYVYGVDFFLGDYVSVTDEELGVRARLQIESVTRSLTNTGEKLDITFGKERVEIQRILRKRGMV